MERCAINGKIVGFAPASGKNHLIGLDMEGLGEKEASLADGAGRSLTVYMTGGGIAEILDSELSNQLNGTGAALGGRSAIKESVFHRDLVFLSVFLRTSNPKTKALLGTSS